MQHPTPPATPPSSWLIGTSALIRHSSFVIRHYFPRLRFSVSPIFLLTLSLACSSRPKTSPTLADQIANAHNQSSLPKNPTLQGTLVLQLESQPALQAEFVCDLPTGRLRLETSDKTTLLFDGRHAYVAPPTAPYKNIRATHLPYAALIALPFKLHDPSTHLTALPDQPLGSTTYSAARVTFSANYPGSPSDWFILFADPKTHRLAAVAFNFTHGRPTDDALQDPRAVTFYDYKLVDGALIPMQWQFWKWHPTEGLFGRPVASARLLNVSTTRAKAPTFTPPPNARLDDPQ